MMDEAHAPGPETSGTAFFTYGLLWGVNNGYLTDQKYIDAAKKGWSYLKGTALQKDGRVGYVQPIGEKAIPGQVVDANSTSNFGVGAFCLLHASMCATSSRGQMPTGLIGWICFIRWPIRF